MSAPMWRRWAGTVGCLFLMLWISRPLTTGGRQWAPSTAAYVVAVVVAAVLWVLMALVEHRRRR